MHEPSYTHTQTDETDQDMSMGETLLLAFLAIMLCTTIPATILAQLLLWALR